MKLIVKIGTQNLDTVFNNLTIIIAVLKEALIEAVTVHMIKSLLQKEPKANSWNRRRDANNHQMLMWEEVKHPNYSSKNKSQFVSQNELRKESSHTTVAKTEKKDIQATKKVTNRQYSNKQNEEKKTNPTRPIRSFTKKIHARKKKAINS